VFAEQVDCLGDEIRGNRVGAADVQEPRLDLGMKANFPHLVSISSAYIVVPVSHRYYADHGVLRRRAPGQAPARPHLPGTHSLPQPSGGLVVHMR
jgi:hypothetical protein